MLASALLFANTLLQECIPLTDTVEFHCDRFCLFMLGYYILQSISMSILGVVLATCFDVAGAREHNQHDYARLFCLLGPGRSWTAEFHALQSCLDSRSQTLSKPKPPNHNSEPQPSTPHPKPRTLNTKSLNPQPQSPVFA